jgi:4-hydroxybenzoate polyprenyltransferase
MEPAGARPLQATQLIARRTGAQALVAELRPRQWLKNLFVFAGIVFAAKLGDASRWVEALACFVAFCAASSASYLVNDVRDAPEDRLHPIKRNRPIARGELSVRTALVLAAVLAAVALAVALALGWRVLLYVAGFLALQAAYSLGVKHLVLLDVMAIGALFVIRAAAGAEAVHVPISEWLLLCTALIALFLGFAKRRGELVLVGADEAPGRAVLEGYSLELVDQLLAVVAAATIIGYGLYTFNADTRAMMATIPFVMFGVFRYLLLVHKHDLGEEPERVLLADPQLIAAVALWAGTAAIILAVN